jgi:hypothetical protein
VALPELQRGRHYAGDVIMELWATSSTEHDMVIAD